MPITVNGISVILAGGVRETTQTTGTGSYSLDGAATVSGITYRTFVAGVGSGNNTCYTRRSGSQFETGIGTVTSGAPATISRALILESSNANAAVNWGAGVSDIFLDAPAALFHSVQDGLDTAVKRIVLTRITANGTFTKNDDCIYALVRIVGGGGGGGGTNATGSGQQAEGGGGGGGEYAEIWLTADELGASNAVTIGAGGAGGTNDGSPGGTTNFGGGLLTALGGSGGSQGIPTATNGTSPGGAGGTGGSGGNFRVPGGPGRAGIVRGGFRQHAHAGGGTLLGTSQSAVTVGSGVAGAIYGGGGTGAGEEASSGARSGGAGAAGVAIITQFCKA